AAELQRRARLGLDADRDDDRPIIDNRYRNAGLFDPTVQHGDEGQVLEGLVAAGLEEAVGVGGALFAGGILPGEAAAPHADLQIRPRRQRPLARLDEAQAQRSLRGAELHTAVAEHAWSQRQRLGMAMVQPADADAVLGRLFHQKQRPRHANCPRSRTALVDANQSKDLALLDPALQRYA